MKVEKKFKLKPKFEKRTYKYKGKEKWTDKYKVSRLNLRDYPVMRTLDKVPDKLEKTLSNMLLDDKPLNNFF